MSDPARRRTWVTWLLIAANVAMFAVELAAGADPIAPKAQDVLHLGADFAPYTLGRHEWWRVVASMFLHFGIAHIAMNMLCLWQGRIVEVIYGRAGFAAIYFVAGVLGGVGSLARGGFVVSAGASGAVFGVFGAFGAFLLLRRAQLEPGAWEKSARGLSAFIVINLVYGLQAKGIDITAHIVGLVAGFAVGCALILGRARIARRAAILTVAGIALAIGGLLVLPAPFDLDGVLHDAHVVEHECVTEFNAKREATLAKTITAQQFADAIDHDLLPKWHAMGERLDAVQAAQIPARLVPLVDDLRTYWHDREQAWQLLARIDHDPAAATPEMRAAFHDGETRFGNDIKALEAEQQRLPH